MGIHTLPDTPEDKALEGWAGYKVKCDASGIHATHGYYNMDKKIAYCFTEAGSAEEVWKAHEGMAVPVTDVFEVKRLD